MWSSVIKLEIGVVRGYKKNVVSCSRGQDNLFLLIDDVALKHNKMNHIIDK